MKQFLGSVFKKVIRQWSWVLLICLAILIKVVSYFPNVVETYYSLGLYPLVSSIQRTLFGWIPFSVGDLIYAFIVIVILIKLFQLIKAAFLKKISRQFLVSTASQLLFFILLVYVLFYSLWGLNYSRKGIASQLGLVVTESNKQDLDTLMTVLQSRINYYAAQVDTVKRQELNKKRSLFNRSAEAYKEAEKNYSFLRYRHQSLKPSLYTYLGQYFGFTGYYNPFSGEGQVRTNVPVFIQPFISTHEIAHQIGYAKENEANLVSFLASKSYDDVDFRYAIYYDLYSYGMGEVFLTGDSLLYKKFNEGLHPRVKRDRRELRLFYERTRNVFEPYVSRVYDSYLRLNNQPMGKRTYNQVVQWMIAFYKKYGIESI